MRRGTFYEARTCCAIRWGKAAASAARSRRPSRGRGPGASRPHRRRHVDQDGVRGNHAVDGASISVICDRQLTLFLPSFLPLFPFGRAFPVFLVSSAWGLPACEKESLGLSFEARLSGGPKEAKWSHTGFFTPSRHK